MTTFETSEYTSYISFLLGKIIFLPDTVCSAEWLQGQVMVFWEKHVLPSATLTSEQHLESLKAFPGSVYKKM